MSRKRVQTMRTDHRGFTLVELLIAIAILSIVIAAVCSFILVGSRSYASANSDISVQQEAQLALNQMSDVLIDTTRSVNYAGYDASGSPTLVLKDSEFAFEPEAKSLVMYNGFPVEKTVPGGTSTTTEIEAGNGNKHYQFYWDKNDETLYYAEVDVRPTDVKTTDIHFPPFGDPGWVVLAEHVTKFEADLTQVEEKRVVQLELTFVNGQREYNTSNNVTIRNKVAVNDAEIGPLDRSKTLSVIPKELSVVLEPGETFHFSTPKVTGKNVTDKSVTWSMEPGYSGSSAFLDAANGILQVSTAEPAGDFNVVITTNAKDAEGNHAQATVAVHVKRVSTVALSIPGNSTNEVTSGSEITVQAAVGGTMLGIICDGCGDPVDKDSDVVNQGAYSWEVLEGAEYVTIQDAKVKSADFKIASNAPDGAAIRIRATSYLSMVKAYDTVQGELVLRIKADESAEPFSGSLKYGEDTLLDEIRAGLSTDHPKYVTCIRVVDNSGREPDRVLVYFTTGGGANYRVSPDLFDLDLNGSYTFYMQALDPVSEENRKLYQEGKVGSVIEDGKDAIWEEYINHLETSKPYGYIGTKYPHNKVYYSVLDKPKLTYNYKGVDYKGKNITYDPVNIYTVGLGSGIIGEIRPVGYENIVEDNSVWGKITNSLYVGEGNDSSQWKGVYYFDESSMQYRGSTSIAGGAVELSPKGNPYMKLNQHNNKLDACGNYHIVPGMLYQNKDPGIYEIIGWQGFDFPNLPRNERYYEFDDSTIHVDVNRRFTMDIDDDWYKGQALFPLPNEMAKNVLFPNLSSGDWQITSGGLSVPALRDGWSNSENLEFTYVRYRYISKNGTYEVEPIKVEYRDWEKKIYTHSYGIHVCGESGTKWERRDRGYTIVKDLVCNVKDFEYNGGRYQTYFPLPKESDFPIANGTGEVYYTLTIYNNNMQKVEDLSGVKVVCTKNGDSYEIQFLKEIKANLWIENNHKVTVVSYGKYSWSAGANDEWTKMEGASSYEKKIGEMNLQGFDKDGNTYKMYFPLPTDDAFPFSGAHGTSEGKYAVYLQSDASESSPQDVECHVTYDFVGGKHRITIVNRYWHGQVFGTFECTDGQTSWTKVQ